MRRAKVHDFDTFVRVFCLLGSIADAINIAEVGAFDREKWKGIGEKEVTKRVFLEVKDTLDDNGLDAYLVLGTVVELLFHQTVRRIVHSFIRVQRYILFSKNQHFCGKKQYKIIPKLSNNRLHESQFLHNSLQTI